MATPTPEPRRSLAEAFAATFGGPRPAPCVHCGRHTQEQADHFGADPDGVPFWWTEPAHAECIVLMAAAADALAALEAVLGQLCDTCGAPLTPAEVGRVDVCAACCPRDGEMADPLPDDHGPGCDGPWNCTCGAVA